MTDMRHVSTTHGPKGNAHTYDLGKVPLTPKGLEKVLGLFKGQTVESVRMTGEETEVVVVEADA